MQGTGYIEWNGERYKVLCRQSKTYRSYRLRKSGQYGHRFPDSDLLQQCDIDALLRGETIYI